MYRSARELSAVYDRADLAAQFVLCRTEALVPAGWPVWQHAGWLLAAHPKLRVTDLFARGEPCGWLVGDAIDETGARNGDRFDLDAVPGDTTAFESAFYRFGGRFLGVLVGAGRERVYLDPAGGQSCVYAPSLELVCSTPSLVPYGLGCDDNDELIRDTGVPFNSAVLGFGLTPRRGVQRLLPNHFLDLSNWTGHRHWPTAPIRGDRDAADAVAVVSAVVERHIRAFTADAHVYMPLTAGYDTRSILACARDHVDRAEFITFDIPDRTGRLDVEIACRIAREYGLNHRVIPHPDATVEQLEKWLWRTGFSVAEPRGWMATGAYALLDPSRPEISGVLGEVARAGFWGDLGHVVPITPDALVDALDLPILPQFVELAAAWLRDVPADRPMNIIDLFLVEQYIGPWGAVLPYGEAHSVGPRIFPKNHRDALMAMLGLPDAYKLARRFQHDIIGSRWPELARIPFNRTTGLRHYVRKARRSVWLVRQSLEGPDDLPPRKVVVRSAAELSSVYDRSRLTGQFVLCRSEAFVPRGWPVRRLDTWLLAVHSNLPVAELVAGGSVCGWVIGYPIKDTGSRIRRRIEFSARPDDSAAFEKELYRLGGRFLAVLVAPAAERVYLDSAGGISCVYAPDLELVCSTPSLVPYGLGCDDDEELIRTSGVPLNNAVLGFGLTPRLGVHRLLPNHFLDLARWTVRRHWPEAPIPGDCDPGRAIDVVSAVVEWQIRALTAEGPVYLPLTAGNDSRSILAAARAHQDWMEMITLSIPDRTGRLDVEIASRIAQVHGLNHRVIPYRDASTEQLEKWLWRTGFSVSEPRGWRATGMYAQLGRKLPELTGVGGEVARANYWKSMGSGKPITPGVLLSALALPETPRLVERAEAWMRDAPADRPMNIVDLVMVEQRIGCWASILPYGDANDVTFRIYPLVHRDSMFAMLRLPDAYKISKRFPRDVVRHRWPELGRFPVNREPGLRHVKRVASRRVWLLRRALGRPNSV